MQIMALPCIAAIAFLTLISTPKLMPDVCYETLSSYASMIRTSPAEPANAALSVSQNGVQLNFDMVANFSKRSDLSKRESGAVVDCMEMIGDSANEIWKSLFAMRDLQGQEFKTQMSNIQAWVSAALTNEDTCMDGFKAGKGPDNSKAEGIIGSNVARVARLTSNALALANGLSE